MNRKADFLQTESIRITNRIESIQIANWNALLETSLCCCSVYQKLINHLLHFFCVRVLFFSANATSYRKIQPIGCHTNKIIIKLLIYFFIMKYALHSSDVTACRSHVVMILSYNMYSNKLPGKYCSISLTNMHFTGTIRYTFKLMFGQFGVKFSLV